jgi:hypothetical protein
MKRWILAACAAVILFLAPLGACGGWSGAPRVVGSVAECTLEKLIEQERSKGHTFEVRKLEGIARARDAGEAE